MWLDTAGAAAGQRPSSSEADYQDGRPAEGGGPDRRWRRAVRRRRGAMPARCGRRTWRPTGCALRCQSREAGANELRERHRRAEEQHPEQPGERPSASRRTWTQQEGRDGQPGGPDRPSARSRLAEIEGKLDPAAARTCEDKQQSRPRRRPGPPAPWHAELEALRQKEAAWRAPPPPRPRPCSPPWPPPPRRCWTGTRRCAGSCAAAGGAGWRRPPGARAGAGRPSWSKARGGAGRGAERHQRLRPAPGVPPAEGRAGPGAAI